jgi:UDP-N-acetylmuramyl pentapeptide phosphotransferase/UDP-N-acetylglucosamine-1-phosphate transferase
MNWFFNLLIALCLGAVGAWSVIKIGGSYGLMDLPGYRSSHNRPTPKGGGVGILLAFITASFLNAIPISLWLPTTIISVTGIVDDRIELSKSWRLLVHFACALIVLIGGDNSWGPVALNPLLGLAIGALFIVGTANFFNFMDGINGIAGISAAVGFSFLAVYGIRQGVPTPYIVVDLCVVFACIGFLPFNIPNAKVFMGRRGKRVLRVSICNDGLGIQHDPSRRCDLHRFFLSHLCGCSDNFWNSFCARRSYNGCAPATSVPGAGQRIGFTSLESLFYLWHHTNFD